MVKEKPHKFGGVWSIIKLDRVEAYLRAFTTALQGKGFLLVYIDAFAGSGNFIPRNETLLPLLDDAEETTAIIGSARRAMAIKPDFDRLYFIESKPRKAKQLAAIAKDDTRCGVVHGDANEEVTKICQRLSGDRMMRGVVFLDPFGNSVAWETLEAIRQTEKFDVWYLCPLAGIYRNAPHSMADLTEEKRNSITRILGTSDWVQNFYAEAKQKSLFDNVGTSSVRTLNVDAIENFVFERLKSLFPSVLRPLRLLGPTKAPLFSLFFAVSNPNQTAQKLANRIASHIISKK
ncbi:MAG: three-Cys-motif partner protein TcmP [Rhizomicrobium sp.]